MNRYAVALLVPAGDGHSLTWWKDRAELTLTHLVDECGRVRHGKVHLHIEHGEISKIRAWCETRPLNGR